MDLVQYVKNRSCEKSTWGSVIGVAAFLLAPYLKLPPEQVSGVLCAIIGAIGLIPDTKQKR